MGCRGCAKRINLSRTTDSYIGKKVLLTNREEGYIYTRLASDRTQYGLKLSSGETIWIRTSDIQEILK